MRALFVVLVLLGCTATEGRLQEAQAAKAAMDKLEAKVAGARRTFDELHKGTVEVKGLIAPAEVGKFRARVTKGLADAEQLAEAAAQALDKKHKADSIVQSAVAEEKDSTLLSTSKAQHTAEKTRKQVAAAMDRINQLKMGAIADNKGVGASEADADVKAQNRGVKDALRIAAAKVRGAQRSYDRAQTRTTRANAAAAKADHAAKDAKWAKSKDAPALQEAAKSKEDQAGKATDEEAAAKQNLLFEKKAQMAIEELTKGLSKKDAKVKSLSDQDKNLESQLAHQRLQIKALQEDLRMTKQAQSDAGEQAAVSAALKEAGIEGVA